MAKFKKVGLGLKIEAKPTFTKILTKIGSGIFEGLAENIGIKAQHDLLKKVLEMKIKRRRQRRGLDEGEV